ncbi:Aim45p KNAG_0D02380 [Huiozyma naganishii CBS 8797]|uniref:Probable electron transfer flavoprotein subunit alpha n=1 Tax=Huiozyma naganishii (strain ATCC MYA-139 / BCRC 22969 / CBS 8797 / KCTC 17520 / NBRC 10181 / NCYC 3082 / Yp74L-3) TaxID=1071383 RepID=J7RKI0_HUIN7|nr:hypothetical protein KNAG_0D02380 [Kazachstania naganishii CBS 8797]CCK69988.1 hypothetical protein KNAG_0D02380 [Kazachstania naganishii CBS 8797]
MLRSSICGRNLLRTTRVRPFASLWRNASTLTFLETSQGKGLTPSSLSVLSAAKQLKNPIVAILLGPDAKESSSTLLEKFECLGLEKVIVVGDKRLEHYLPELVSPLLKDLLSKGDYSHFVMASNYVGKSILPRVAALLDNQPVCDVVAIKDPKTFVRPIYAGNALSVVKCSQDKTLISIRASAFEPVTAGSSKTAKIEELNYERTEEVDIRWEGCKMVDSDMPDLTSAKIVVAGGRALKDKETFDSLLVPLAKKLHGAIGATRAAVDNGFCNNSLQVGQTGKIVAPDLYIAAGISGAVQHLAGMKDSKIVVAINNDPDAPIFKNADLGIEGDVFEILPELTKKLP